MRAEVAKSDGVPGAYAIWLHTTEQRYLSTLVMPATHNRTGEKRWVARSEQGTGLHETVTDAVHAHLEFELGADVLERIPVHLGNDVPD